MNFDIDWDKFTFRCSSLGYIMQEAKGKSNLEKYNELLDKFEKKQIALSKCTPTQVKASEKLYDECDKLVNQIDALKPFKDDIVLSETTKVHLSDIYTRVVYGRNEDIKSKYLEKGLLLEEDAITAYSMLTGKMYRKNKVRKSNEWIEGEMDFDEEEYVNDAKVNWSIFQFNRVASRPISHLYKWQLEGYMWLFNKPKGRLVYALLNTPEHLIKQEEKNLLYNGTIWTDELYQEACAEIRKNHIYDDIPLEKKIRTFETEACEENREKIKQKVNACRTYLKNLSNYSKIDTEENTEEVVIAA